MALENVAEPPSIRLTLQQALPQAREAPEASPLPEPLAPSTTHQEESIPLAPPPVEEPPSPPEIPVVVPPVLPEPPAVPGAPPPPAPPETVRRAEPVPPKAPPKKPSPTVPKETAAPKKTPATPTPSKPAVAAKTTAPQRSRPAPGQGTVQPAPPLHTASPGVPHSSSKDGTVTGTLGTSAPAAHGTVDVKTLKILNHPSPEYPNLSRKRGEEGTVTILITIVSGKVAEATVEQGSGYPRLDNAALHAVRRWTFDHQGTVRARVPVRFTLK